VYVCVLVCVLCVCFGVCVCGVVCVCVCVCGFFPRGTFVSRHVNVMTMQ